MKAEYMHAKLEPVVIRAMCPEVPRKTAAHTRHVEVKTLHNLVQTMLGATADHDIGMSRPFVITL